MDSGRRVAVAAIVLTGLAVLSAVAPSATAAAQTMKSQWDGVYSLAQAKRGEALYGEHCAACHGPDLAGGEAAPALGGGVFAANWNQLTLADLFERLRTSMPSDNPSALSRAQKIDILAFVLYKGNYPSGDADLPAQTDALKAIGFLASRPGAQ